MSYPDLLLRQEELRTLTGYSARARQVSELERLRIPYLVNARGHLCVARAAAEHRLGVHSSAPATSDEPDFSAFT